MIGKKFEKNNLTVALSILYTKETAYISKHNSTWKKLIFLRITNKEKEGWHYLAVKKLSAILHKNIRVVFIVWIVLILLEQKVTLSLMKKQVKIKISMEL